MATKKEELWEEFLEFNPNDTELADVIDCIPAFCEKAATLLLSRDNVCNNNLLAVLRTSNVSMPLREKAAEKILVNAPTDDDLHLVIVSATPAYALSAANYLLDRCKPNEDTAFRDYMIAIVKHCPSLAAIAGQKILGNQPRRQDLEDLFCNVPELAEKAANYLLDNSPTKSELALIAARVPSLQKRVRKALGRSKGDVLRDMKHLSAD